MWKHHAQRPIPCGLRAACGIAKFCDELFSLRMFAGDLTFGVLLFGCRWRCFDAVL